MQIETNSIQKETKAHGDFSFPLLVSYERLGKYESGSFLWHWHPEIELTLFTKGKIRYKINNEEFVLEEGNALFCNSGIMHSGEMVESQDCSYIPVTFDPRVIYGYEGSIIYSKFVKPIIQDFYFPYIIFDGSEEWHKEVIELIKKIIKINEENSEEKELEIVICLSRFWQLIFKHRKNIPQPKVDSNIDFERLRSIITYIELNYEGKITLEDISEKINLCKEECCRLFKRCMNTSIFDYIIRFRIEKSAKLLKETKNPVTLIAQSVGFNDANHFAKLFRRQKGVSPSEYRKAKGSK